MGDQRYLFELAHPKHFHQLRFLIERLRENHEVLIIARDKDVVLKLLADSGLSYEVYGRHGKGILEKLLFTPYILIDYIRVLKRFRPDWIISRSSPYATVIAPLLGSKTIILPDSEVVWLINNFVAPRADYVISPSSYALDFGKKHHRVKGLFEEAYLHPNYFRPDPCIKTILAVEEGEPYFVLRFVGWHANHDVKNHGFTLEEKRKLIKKLEEYGRVFITNEGCLPEDFQKYRLSTPPNKIHHALHFASLYIGDSQTMATEAALLGTPAIRCNTFVGPNDMTNFKLLEDKYGMLMNVRDFQDVMDAVSTILENPKAKLEAMQRRERYFKDKGDMNAEMIDILSAIANNDTLS